MKFSIKKDEISRLKVFADYLKRMETVSPLEKNQLFSLENNKLSIYGYGNGSLGSGNIEASFDVISSDKSDFYSNVGQFISTLEKTKSDEITVTLSSNAKLSIKGDKSKSVFTQVVLGSMDTASAEEIKKAISNYETSNYFGPSIDVNVSNVKAIISNASAMTNALGTNRFIKLTCSTIESVDNLSVIKIPVTDVVTEDVYMLKTVTNLLHDVDSFKSYNDSGRYWFYFDVAVHGIKFYFAQPTQNYECPSDDDLKNITSASPYTMTISGEKFFNAIEEFEGMFDSASWRYKQIKFIFDKSAPNIIKLHFDNMVTCVDTELEVENSSVSENFEILLPMLHMKYVEDLLKAEDFTLSLSAEEDKLAVILKNSKADILLTKMSE